MLQSHNFTMYVQVLTRLIMIKFNFFNNKNLVDINKGCIFAIELEQKYKLKTKNIMDKHDKQKNYDRSFESYVNSSSLSISDKDSIKKLIKYEKIANLRFFKQSLELIKEGEDNGKQ